MKRNYQLELDRITASLSGRPRLLLHSCCGPCSSYVLEYLTRYFEVFLSYYNPNIQPRAEYDLRLENQLCVLGRMPGVTLVPCGYDGGAYDEAVRGLEDEPEGGARCTECFKLRLDFAAAWQWNPGLMLILPFLALLGGRAAVRYVRTGQTKPPRWERAIMVLLVAFLVVYGVARNLPGLTWLAPGQTPPELFPFLRLLD